MQLLRLIVCGIFGVVEWAAGYLIAATFVSGKYWEEIRFDDPRYSPTDCTQIMVDSRVEILYRNESTYPSDLFWTDINGFVRDGDWGSATTFAIAIDDAHLQSISSGFCATALEGDPKRIALPGIDLQYDRERDVVLLQSDGLCPSWDAYAREFATRYNINKIRSGN